MGRESSQRIKTLLENGEIEAAVSELTPFIPRKLAEVLACDSPLRITLIDKMEPRAVGPALEFLEPLHRETGTRWRRTSTGRGDPHNGCRRRRDGRRTDVAGSGGATSHRGHA